MYMDLSDFVKDIDLMFGLLMVRIFFFVLVFYQNSRIEEEKVFIFLERDIMFDREVCILYKFVLYWIFFLFNILFI